MLDNPEFICWKTHPQVGFHVRKSFHWWKDFLVTFNYDII